MKVICTATCWFGGRFYEAGKTYDYEGPENPRFKPVGAPMKVPQIPEPKPAAPKHENGKKAKK